MQNKRKVLMDAYRYQRHGYRFCTFDIYMALILASIYGIIWMVQSLQPQPDISQQCIDKCCMEEEGNNKENQGWCMAGCFKDEDIWEKSNKTCTDFCQRHIIMEKHISKCVKGCECRLCLE